MVTTTKARKKLPESSECAQAMGKQAVIGIYRSLGARADGGVFSEGSNGMISIHSLDREDSNASAAFNPTTGVYCDLGSDRADSSKSLGQVLLDHDNRFSSYKEAMDWLREQAGFTTSTGKGSQRKKTSKPRIKTTSKSKQADGSKQTEEILPLEKNLLKHGVSHGQIMGTATEPYLRKWCEERPPFSPQIIASDFGARYKYESVKWKDDEGEWHESRGAKCLAFPVYWIEDLTVQIGLKLLPFPFFPHDLGVIPTLVNGSKPKGIKTKLVLFQGMDGRQGVVMTQGDRQRILSGNLEGWSAMGVEGETDCIAAVCVRPADAKVIIFTNANGAKESPLDHWKKTFPVDTLYHLGDNDIPGQAGNKRRASTPTLPGQKSFLIRIPGEITDKHGRDLKDVLVEHFATPDKGWSKVEEMIYRAESVSTETLDPDADYQADVQQEDEPESDLDIAEGFVESTEIEGVCPYYIIRDRLYRWNGTKYGEISSKVLRHHLWKWLNENGYNPTQRKVSSVFDALESIITTHHESLTPSTLHWRQPPPDEIPLEADFQCCIPTRTQLIIPNGSIFPSEWGAFPRPASFFTRDTYAWDYGTDSRGRLEWEEPEQFLAFLKQIFDGEETQIHALQSLLGYWMSGLTNQQRIGFLVGPTRSGKGLLTRICKKVVGESQVIGSGFFNLANNFGLSQFVNAKLAILSDERKVTKQVVEQVLPILLKISGEDDVAINEKYRAEYTAKVNARLLIVSNQLNLISDECQALSSRLVLLQTRRSFAGSEDVNLERRIHEELPGIVMWGAAGLARILNGERLESPEETRDELEDMVDSDNPLNPFFRYLEADDPNKVPASERHCIDKSELLELAREWASEKGIESFKTLSPRRLTEALKNRFHHVKPVQVRIKSRDESNPNAETRRWAYQGIRVNSKKIDFTPHTSVTTYERKS